MIQKAATVVDIEVGRKLKAARLLKGLTQETLSAAIGLTFQQLQKYEKGTNRISVGRLVALATALSVPVTHLLPLETPGAVEDPLAEILSSKDGRELATIFLAQNAAHRSALVEIAKVATAIRA